MSEKFLGTCKLSIGLKTVIIMTYRETKVNHKYTLMSFHMIWYFIHGSNSSINPCAVIIISDEVHFNVNK